MFETYYRRKALTTKAVQYDGTKDMAEDLASEYFHLEIYGSNLYFSLYYDEEELISNGDWLLIDEGKHVFEVVEKDLFDDIYEEIDGKLPLT